MTQTFLTDAARLTRRAALRSLGLAAGGTTMLAAGMIANPAAAQSNKMAQKAVGYQDTPKGDANCGNCSKFIAPAACKIVAGDISPTAWCRLYSKKAA
jgi:hypothetical protein